MGHSKIDPIVSEVIGYALQSIAEEMGVSLVRSAYSTNIKERRDCSCALFTQDGELVALAEHIPIHLGSMQGLMTLIAKYLQTWNFRPGDVVIANDPYLGGGSHLPDVTLVQPVFMQNELVAFSANIAHWSDVGGSSPGVGTAGSSTEIFQEGLRIPPVPIIVRRKVREDILEFLVSNMRNPEERRGDFRAQVAALRLGESRLLDLFRRYGVSTTIDAIHEQFDHSERMLREELREVPEGSYSFEDVMDDDGIIKGPIPIRVKITVTHGQKPNIHFDFSGTAPQVEGGINMVWPALTATVYYAVKAVVSPDVPPNAGFQRPIRILAEKGSLVHALEPAAVGGRTDTCQRVVDAVMGALSRPVPDRIIAASNGATTAVIFGGTKRLTGKDFVYVEALGGGMGARSSSDGMDGVQVHITNTSNLPIEAMELEYPLRVLSYRLVSGSGGAGRYRGGLSLRKDIQALAPVIFAAHSDRHRNKPWGLKGGLPGRTGRFLLNPGKPARRRIPSKISGLLIPEGAVLSAQTAGGGGFGPPQKRDPELVSRDVLQGKISRKTARDIYGVSLSWKGKVDFQQTKSLRARMAQEEKKR